jgi:Pyridoxamine 5'-phosphate oxidase
LRNRARIGLGTEYNFTEARMNEPQASRPYWPDAVEELPDATTGLKPWSWALEHLEKSHNYWIATSRPDGTPHLMIVWGIWWQDAFWFSTGPRARKAKNIASNPRCVIGTEKADEAVIVEGTAQEIKDRAIWKQVSQIYDRKYGGNVYPMLESCGGNVYRVTPHTAFGQDEHAANFAEAATRWRFS